MKKIFLMMIFSGFLFASVGHFVIVRGDVEVVRDSKVLKAKSGMAIENKDEITTKGVAKAQIKFNDDTVVSLGKNTTFKVEDYLNDNDGKKLHMGVNKGSFKVITGGIAKVSRDNFVFTANNAVIGVRGTIFAGEVGQKHKQDTIACVQGAIDVKVGNDIQRINAGMMVEIKGNKLSDIKALDSAKIETINTINASKVDSKSIDAAKQEFINIKQSGDKDAILKAKQEYVEAKKQMYENNSAKSYQYYEQSNKRDSGYQYNKEYNKGYNNSNIEKQQNYQDYKNRDKHEQNYNNYYNKPTQGGSGSLQNGGSGQNGGNFDGRSRTYGANQQQD